MPEVHAAATPADVCTAGRAAEDLGKINTTTLPVKACTGHADGVQVALPGDHAFAVHLAWVCRERAAMFSRLWHASALIMRSALDALRCLLFTVRCRNQLVPHAVCCCVVPTLAVSACWRSTLSSVGSGLRNTPACVAPSDATSVRPLLPKSIYESAV